MTKTDGVRVAIDIGGTFTDTVLVAAEGDVLATNKTPTTPQNPTLGALDGVSKVLKKSGKTWGAISGFIHGTTLATNALIERRGARVATITTEGFRDILEIGYERRYSQYDINLQKPDLIVPRRCSFTIGGRITATGEQLAPLDDSAVPDLVKKLIEHEVDAVAICLLHSYANPSHEKRLRSLVADHLPTISISISSEVSPEAREFDRLCTTIANAYIQPLMASYLQDFQQQFTEQGLTCPILMMTAGGGMTTLKTAAALPIRLVESGPAGGAILAARIARQAGADSVLSFDMGGTTAKLCLIDNFKPQSARRFEIARAERFIKGSGMPVRIPVLEMIEIGAGGGSIAKTDRLGRIQVGPESAGSEPGPAAFGRGGICPTVTDADIIQGLIEPARFAEGRLKIDVAASEKAMQSDLATPLGITVPEAASGLSDIVDENMAAAGRMHAVESGKDLGHRTMIAFGGNGPLHATRVARRAGVSRILIPNDPGVGSAVGFLFAPISFEIVRSRYARLDDLAPDQINEFFDAMIEEATEVVRAGRADGPLIVSRSAFMRYLGQGHEIELTLPDKPLVKGDFEALRTEFEAAYRNHFSRAVPGMTIEILNWSVHVSTPPEEVPKVTRDVAPSTPTPDRTQKVLCDVAGQFKQAPVYDRMNLSMGDMIPGPALIVEPQTTTFVSADFAAAVGTFGEIVLTKVEA